MRGFLASAARITGLVVGLVLLAVAAGALYVTQTESGRDLARAYVEATLRDAVSGRVRVGRVTGGNLFTHASLASLSIRTPEGDPFLLLEGVRLEYDIPGLLRGRYEFRNLRAKRLELEFHQARDGAWNFERIFEGPGDEPGDGLLFTIAGARVEDGRVELRIPWTPESEVGSPAAEREREESIWVMEASDEGFEQVVSVDSLRGRLPFLRIADPESPAEYRLEEVAGTLRAVKQSLEVREFTATAVLRDEAVGLTVERARLGASRLHGEGEIYPETSLAFRFDLRAEPLAFEDLAWLPVPVPREGGGSADLVLRSDGDIFGVEVREGDFRAGDSRLAGGFSLLLEDPPRLESFDLDLRPLRLALADELLERETGQDGYLEGPVAGSGPLDLLHVDGRIRLTEAGGAPGGPTGSASADGSEEPSHLEVSGEIGATGPHAMRDLRLTFRDFDPRWSRVLGIDTRQRGRVSGVAVLDGRPGGTLSFSGDIEHRLPAGERSHLRGGGSIDLASGSETSLQVEVAPLSLAVVEPYAPELDLAGEVRGSAVAFGPLEALRARADLETPRGAIEFDGRFDLAAERRRYDARVRAREIQLRQWLPEAPDSRIAVRGSVRGEGTDLENLDALFDLEILPSSVERVQIDSSRLRFRIEGGLATVDTVDLRTEIGRARGAGSLGADPGRRGSLDLDLEVPDLSALNRWIVGGRTELGADTTTGGLFTEFPETTPEEDPATGNAETAPDSLAGSLTGSGVLTGSVRDFGVDGRARIRDLRYGESRADSVRVAFGLEDLRSLESPVAEATLWNLAREGLSVDSVAARLLPRGTGRSRVEVFAARGDSVALAATTDMTWAEGRTEARVDGLELTLGDRDIRLRDTARVVYGDSGLVVEDFVAMGSGGGRIGVRGRIPARGAAEFGLALERLNLGDIALLIDTDRDIEGTLNGRLEIGGTADAPVMEAQLALENPAMGRLSYSHLGGSFRYEDRLLRGDAALEGQEGPLLRLEGQLAADLSFRAVEDRLLDRPIDVGLVADSIPLALLELWSDVFHEVEGTAAGDVRVQGAPGDLRVDGQARLNRGSAWIVPLGVRFRDARSHVRFRGSEAILDSLTVRGTEGGRGRITGSVELADLRDPGFDLEIGLEGLRSVDRYRISGVLEGSGRLEGSYRQPNFTGDFRLYDGTLRQDDIMRQGEAVDLTDPEVYALLDTASVRERRLLARVRNPFLQNLRADVQVEAGPDFWLRSRDLEVELAGDLELRMDRAEGDVRVFGPLTLVQGNYWFSPVQAYRRQLRIVEGRLEFVGTPGLDPNLQITAENQIRTAQGDIVVQAHLGGTLRSPTLSLSSDPPMDDSDQICLLLVNTPCAGSESLAGGLDVGLVQEQLLGRVGSQLSQILVGEGGPDYVTVRSGTGASGPGGDAAAGDRGAGSTFLRGTEVEVGWYLSPEVFLSVTLPLGSRYPAGSLLWRFARGWSLEARSENRFGVDFGRTSSSNLDTDRMLGLFLFREWSF